MRLPLILLLLTGSVATATAQNASFNPYQATLDRMPLAEAEPLIVAAYGPVEHRSTAPGIDYDGGPIQVLSMGKDKSFALFLFCSEKLSAIIAPVLPAMAASIAGPLTLPDQSPSIYVDKDVLMLTLTDELALHYSGIGTKSSGVSVYYPSQMALTLDFKTRCDVVN